LPQKKGDKFDGVTQKKNSGLAMHPEGKKEGNDINQKKKTRCRRGEGNQLAYWKGKGMQKKRNLRTRYFLRLKERRSAICGGIITYTKKGKRASKKRESSWTDSGERGWSFL